MTEKRQYDVEQGFIDAADEWGKGANVPEYFDSDKWENCEDAICIMQPFDCEGCPVAAISGAPYCNKTPIQDAFAAYAKWSGDKSEENKAEWRQWALAVSEFFELSLIELMKDGK